MFNLKQTFQQEECLKSQIQSTFNCNICKSIAQQPVVAECGHLFCWNCIHNKNQCSVCFKQILETQFIPIFTSHQNSNQKKYAQTIRPKPRAKNRQKIKNYNNFSNQQIPRTTNLGDNIQMEVPIVGNGYFPSIFVNSLGDFGQIQQEFKISKSNIKNSINNFWIILLIIISFGIIFS